MLVGELSLDGTLRPVRGALVDRRLRAPPGHSESAGSRRQRRRSRRRRRRASVRHAASVRSGGVSQSARSIPAHAVVAAIVRLLPKNRFPISATCAARPRAKRALEVAAAGRPQRADDRAARLRQDHARETIRRHSAAADLSRIHRDHADPQRRRTAAARRRTAGPPAVSRAASHRVGRGADRRRLGNAASRRSQPGAQRRAVPGRAARVPAQRPGNAAPAARRIFGHARAHQHDAFLSRPTSF